jgi:hypothetical protein
VIAGIIHETPTLTGWAFLRYVENYEWFSCFVTYDRADLSRRMIVRQRYIYR